MWASNNNLTTTHPFDLQHLESPQIFSPAPSLDFFNRSQVTCEGPSSELKSPLQRSVFLPVLSAERNNLTAGLHWLSLQAEIRRTTTYQHTSKPHTHINVTRRVCVCPQTPRWPLSPESDEHYIELHNRDLSLLTQVCQYGLLIKQSFSPFLLSSHTFSQNKHIDWNFREEHRQQAQTRADGGWWKSASQY